MEERKNSRRHKNTLNQKPDSLRFEAENAEIQNRFWGVRQKFVMERFRFCKKDLETKQIVLKSYKKIDAFLREEITQEDIAEVVSRWTGIPLSRMLETERSKLSRMENELNKRVVGQDEAIEKKLLILFVVIAGGISDPNKPIGSFIFLGPTGVGKQN